MHRACLLVAIHCLDILQTGPAGVRRATIPRSYRNYCSSTFKVLNDCHFLFLHYIIRMWVLLENLNINQLFQNARKQWRLRQLRRHCGTLWKLLYIYIRLINRLLIAIIFVKLIKIILISLSILFLFIQHYVSLLIYCSSKDKNSYFINILNSVAITKELTCFNSLVNIIKIVK